MTRLSICSMIVLLGLLCPVVLAPFACLRAEVVNINSPRVKQRVFAEDYYPIIVYAVDVNTTVHFPKLKSIGVTTVHTYGMGIINEKGQFDIEKDRKYLDAAHKAGLKVMVNLSGHRFLLNKNGAKFLKQYIDAIKDHPAVEIWYLCDEPDLRDISPQIISHYRKLLNKWTPGIPVAVAVAWSKTYRHYAPAVDILMGDNYAVKSTAFPKQQINGPLRLASQCIATGTPYIPIHQMFNQKVFAGKKKIYKGEPADKMRYPELQELRYLSFASLVVGSRGLSWYSHYRCITFPGGLDWLKSTFEPVNKEFSSFIKLVEPAPKRVFFDQAMDINVFMAMWKRENGTYLVVINNWPRSQKVFRSMKDTTPQNIKLSVWGQTRKDINAKIKNGKIEVDMKPWEVSIFQLGESKDEKKESPGKSPR